MAEVNEQGCPNCRQLQAEIETLKTRQAEIEAELAKARKHSGNSSKPPSSDIVKPPKDKPAGKDKDKKRKRGGQKGHARHQRPLFAPEEISLVKDYRYSDCPCCGGALQDCGQPAKIQQHIEIKDIPVTISEHRRIAQYCPHCDKVLYRSFPEHLVKAGLVGPRLTALVGFFKGACHMSFSAIRKFFRDVMGVPISRGHLAKLVAKVSDSLYDPYEELLKLLPEEDLLNVDETGHKDLGKRLWTWCFRASLYTLFKISPSRGSDVLVAVLGKEFDGILGCDYFSAYRKYMKDFNVVVQFCLAHFIRDVKFLAEHPNADNRAYGELLLGHLRQLFGIIHRRDQYATQQGFRCALGRVRDTLIGEAILASPGTREADNLANRFVVHYESYFRFITEPGVDPTNNLAEQAIRFVAIHRRLTQGTRGQTGQTWCERIWTAVVSCAQQGRSIFEFLCEAITAHFRGKPAPSLLPNTS
jgi:transposase